jgi:pimeloyl-ACP methyl ester carboxylesterase
MAVAVTEQGIGALEAALPPLLGATSRAEQPELVARVRRQALSADPAGVAWSQRAMAARPDSTATLAALPVPTMVMIGEEDELIGVEQAHRMAVTVPGAMFLTIPGTGHLAPLERPRTVASGLTGLLLHVRPGPAAGSPPRA